MNARIGLRLIGITISLLPITIGIYFMFEKDLPFKDGVIFFLGGVIFLFYVITNRLSFSKKPKDPE